MKRFSLIVCLMVVTIMAAYAATYQIASLPTKGEHRAPGISLAKPVHIVTYGMLPDTGTVIIKQIVDGIYTNTICTVTNAAGTVSAEIKSTNYFAAGDILLREGTCTNGSVRLIFSGD